MGTSSALRLVRAPDVASFVAHPAGRCVAGRSFLYWCAADAFGFALWGRPDMADMQALAQALEIELADAVAPHVSLVDAQRVLGVDPAAFDVLHGYVRRNFAPLRAKVTRLALVRPAGLAGAVVAGFYQVLESPYPTRLFADATEAAAWLSLDPALASAVAGAVADATGVDPALAALRAVLRAPGPAPSIELAARRLSLSTRTLQRRLTRAGTSFVAEVLRARVELAQDRMRESADPLTTIAIEAGFASLQHFSAAFRRHTGMAPSAWRATVTAAGG